MARHARELAENQRWSAAVRRLEFLRKQPIGWDGEGSVPVTSQAQDLAQCVVLPWLFGFLPLNVTAAIFPTHSGGISIEWDVDSWSTDVEILPDGDKVLIGGTLQTTCESWEREIKMSEARP